MDLIGYISEVIDYEAATAPDCVGIDFPTIPSFPIPFFGEVDRARVLTVGVNPSDGEFRNRNWPESINAKDLTQRLLGYFKGSVPPHPWFNTWSKALKVLNLSYESGAVAHLDLSPRPTIPMGQQNQDCFCSMIGRDVQWFAKLLDMVKPPLLILMSGTVTKRYYINDFLDRSLPQYGWELHEKAENHGIGRVGKHFLEHSDGRRINCFFCSISPSARNANVLIQRINEHADHLRNLVQESS